jgi:hypothetical protein
MELGDPLHMRLVDDRLIEWPSLWSVVTPIEGLVDDDRPGHEWRTVTVVDEIRMTGDVGQKHVGLLNHSVDRLAVGIEEQFVRIVKQPIIRCPAAVDSESVSMPGMYVGHVPVMNETVHLRESETRLVT